MVKIAFIFFKRNIRLYLRVSFFSFFFLLLVSFFAIGYASFERFTVTKTLNEVGGDYSAVGTISKTFTINNISTLFSYGSEWKDIDKSWVDNINRESLILIVNTYVNDKLLFLGIDLLNNSDNVKRDDILDYTIDFFGSKINISAFKNEKNLPFNLDILMNINDLTFSFPSNIQITPYNSQIGYFVDLSTNRIFSLRQYTKIITDIEDFFYLFVAQRNLVYLSSICSDSPDLEIIDPFIEPFKALVMLFSFISLLLSSWLIDVFLKMYYNQIREVLEKFEKRGFSKKDSEKIVKILPIITDTLTFLVICSLYLTSSLLFHINPVTAIIAVGVGYLYLVYKRIKFKPFNDEISEQLDTLSFIIYILLLLLFSVIPIIIKRTLYSIVPSWISSLISIGSTITQYYIVTLLLSELFLRIYKKNRHRKSFESLSLDQLIAKSLISEKKHLKSWFHSTIILIWSISIIFVSVQTFNVNYQIHQTMLYPTDAVINIDLPLVNITQLEALSEVKYIIPITHNVEQYFLDYDLYLINFSAIQLFLPELCKLSKVKDLKSGYSYMYKSMASELDFSNNDLFPTKFGKNLTNIIVDQPIIITKYFPLIKPISNRPFVVSDYRQEYENFTIVNKLLIRFRDNIETNRGLDAIRNTLGMNLNIESPLVPLSYNLSFAILQYFFLLVTLFIGGLNFIQLINQLFPIFGKVYLRGLEQKNIKLLFTKTMLPFIISSAIIAFLSALFYLFVQMGDSIYHISLFIPLKLFFDIKLLFLVSVPILYFTIIYVLNFKKRIK